MLALVSEQGLARDWGTEMAQGEIEPLVAMMIEGAEPVPELACCSFDRRTWTC